MMASLYGALNVDELAGRGGVRETRRSVQAETLRWRRRSVPLRIALVSDPDLIILDEPTDGDGCGGAAGVLDDDAALAERGKTVIFATHYLEEADEYADREMLMANGRIIADGADKEIKEVVGYTEIRRDSKGHRKLQS